MAKMYLLGAGHSFRIGDNAYAKLISFADKVSLLGIKSRISPKTYDSTISLFTRCSYASKSGDFVIIINERQNPNGDVGKEMLCDWFKLGIHTNEQMAQQLEKDRHKYEQVPPEILEQMPMLPENSILIPNPIGIEPGYILDIQDKLFFFLPHQPNELFSMLDECILPVLANLTGKEIAVEKVTVSGLEMPALEVHISELLKKESDSVYFEFSPQEKTIEITLTAFAGDAEAAKSLAARSARLIRDSLWPNLSEEYSSEVIDALKAVLRSKKITLAAAVSGKDLVREFTGLLPGVFHYLLNAGPPAVREMVFEVPRAYLHENDGVNCRSAMYIAHNATGLCNTEAGFALVMAPDMAQAFMALSAAGKITWREFDLPRDIDGQKRARFAHQNIIDFCMTALEYYPDRIPDSVPVDELLSEPEEVSAAFRFLRPERRHA